MATLTLTSTDQTVNVPLMTSGNLFVSTSVTYTSPPATVTVKVRQSGLIPGVDFVIPDMVWTLIDTDVYEGAIELPYSVLHTETPHKLDILPQTNATTGYGTGVFSLHANGYTVGGSDVSIAFTGVQDTVVSPSPLVLSQTKDTSEIHTVFILNDSNSEMVITHATIPSGLTAAGLTYYDTLPITIPIGQTRGIIFTFAPTTVFPITTGNIVFERTGFENLTLSCSLTSTEVGIVPSITPDESVIAVDVIQGVSGSFQNSILFNTNQDSGVFEMTSNSSDLKFGESLSGSNAIYREYFTEDQAKLIPFTIETSDVPGIKQIILTWRLLDQDGVSTLTSGIITVNARVDAPAVDPVCMFSFLDTMVQITDLKPLDEGVFNYNILPAFDPAEEGDFEIELTLPLNDNVVSFDATAIGALTLNPGIAYDLSDIASNPSKIKISLTSGSLVGTFSSLLVPMKYAIPANPGMTILTSFITLNATFDNPMYLCTGKTADLYMGVSLSATSGGYETKVKVETGIQCVSLNITDNSNFGADGNHDAADFDIYRKLIITLPSGINYVESTYPPMDILITPASSGITLFQYPVTKGGIYKVYLEQAPTYTDGGTYSVDDCVVKMEGEELAFYQSTTNGNTGHEPGISVGWEDWWEQISSLPAPYTDIKYYMQWCEIANCKKTLARKVFCDMNTLCRLNMCNNQCFQNYEKVKLLERMLAEAEYNQWYDRMVVLYNMLTQVCSCSSCD